MVRRQLDELDSPVDERRAGADEQGVETLACKSREGRDYLIAVACVQHPDLQAHGAGRRFQVSQNQLGIRRIGRVDQRRHAGRRGHQFTQQFQSFRRQFAGEKVRSGEIPTRAREAGDKTELDRVGADVKDDGDRCGCSLGRACGSVAACGNNDCDLFLNQIFRQRR
jgi:hypothetical protein